MKKRIISILTALALSLSLCPTWAFATEADGAPVPAQTGDGGTTVAQVTIGGETRYYATLEEAFDAANGQTATITLLADAGGSEDDPLNLYTYAGSVTLHGCGHTLSQCDISAYGTALEIDNCTFRSATMDIAAETATLTGCTITGWEPVKIDNNGEIIVIGNNAVVVGGETKATFNNCTVSGGSGGRCALFVAVGADVTINGGTFTGTEGSAAGLGIGGSGLNLGSTLKLRGGTFSGKSASIQIDYFEEVDITLADLLGHTDETRYAYYNADGTLIKEGLDGGTFTETVEVKPCTHELGADGKCPACGGDVVAQVTTGGTTTCYVYFPKAWAAVQGQTATLKLLKSVDIGENRSLSLSSGNVTLEMEQNVALSGNNSSATIIVSGGTLTMNSGTVSNTGNCGIQNQGGTLRITGGAVNGGTGKSGVWADDGTTEISGGRIDKLYPQKNAKVSLSGGTFDAIEIWDLTTGSQVAGLLAEDYAFKRDGAWVSDADGNSLTGTVTVEKAPVKITAQPTGSEVIYGKSAALSVTAQAAGSEKAVAYQWYLADENGDTAVAGAASASYTAADLGAGTYQYYCAVTCDGYTVKSETVTVTVNPRPLTPAITGTAVKTYDGTTDVPSGQLSITLTDVLERDTVTAVVSYAYDNANAGENKTIIASGITLSGTNAGNYTLTSDDATTTGSINKAPLTAARAAIKTRPYQPNAYAAEVSGVIFNGLKNGETLALGEDYAAYGNYGDLNAGTNKPATITVELKSSPKANNYNLTNSSVNATGTITKASSSITKAPTATGLTYGQALRDSNLSGGAGNVAGAFAWTDGAAKPHAGTAECSVTFTPTDPNYNAATGNVSVTVAKAAPAITWDNAAQTLDYTGSEAEIAAPTVTLVDGESFSGTFSYSHAASGSSDYVSGLPVNAGTYAVKASIAEQDNYTAAESGVRTLTINKVNYTGATTASAFGKFGVTKTYDLSGLLPEGYALEAITTTDPEGVFAGAPTVIGTVLTYTLVNHADRVDKTGDIIIPVAESTNYNPFNLTLTVTVTDIQIPDLTVTPISVTYTGSPVPDGKITGTATVEGEKIKGTWSFVSGQALTNVADSGVKEVVFTPEDTNLYGTAHGTVAVTIRKAAPELALTAAPKTLTGGGTVRLTLTGLPVGGAAAVTCSGGVSVTPGTGNTWTAALPNHDAAYTFTASYAGNASYLEASASCVVTVKAKEVIILPNPPAGNKDEQYQLVMETGVSEVPDGLKGIEALETPEKLESAMKTEISKANSDVPPENAAVYDVTLMVSTDGGKNWLPAQKENFPSEGLPVTLPYPEGTDSNFRFTVVHMFTTADFGKQPGDTEVFTPDQVKNTARGLQIVVTGLSPISVGWTAPAANPSTPPSGSHGGGGVGSSSPSIRLPNVKPAGCDGGADCPAHGFTDLGGVGMWYHEAVDYVLKNGLMNGYSGTRFGPEENLSRAQLAQILYNKEGRPNVTGGNVFNDVADGKWYAPAITWAAGNGIVSGYGGGAFGPNDNITREQLAVMLWRYAGNPAATEKELHFADAGKVSRYAAEALRWAVENGIVNGVGGGILDPQGLATRAQTAQMLKNFLDHKS